MVNKVDIVSNMLERDLEEAFLKVFGRAHPRCMLPSLQGLEPLPAPESLEKPGGEVPLSE